VSLRERQVASTLLSVAFSTLLVGAVDLITAHGPGRGAWITLAAALAFVLAMLSNRLIVQQPLEGQVQRLMDFVRKREDLPVDVELQGLKSALQGRIDEIEGNIDALRREARAATEAVESSPFGIALVDAEGRITSANPVFRRVFWLRGEPVGKRPIEVVPVVEIHEVVEEALAGRTCERIFVTASLDLVARAQPLSEGRAIVRVEDVTGRREAERARTDFVANVSHELRTPLTAIMGYLETLMNEADRLPEDLFPLLETVDRNARRLRDLFQDLLKLHRIEARRRELPLERHELLPILEEAVGPARDRAAMKGQQFALDCPPTLKGLVNPEALGAIVGNLAANASAYTPEGGHIWVRCKPGPRGHVDIEVQDDGIGISEKHHERIFERFYRVDEARSRKAGGTGLGLAIVKHYALAARCNVTLRSREGEGSTFTVELPVE
jgi:two-component system phosphate regulon sensor histidine kinase PhoR